MRQQTNSDCLRHSTNWTTAAKQQTGLEPATSGVVSEVTLLYGTLLFLVNNVKGNYREMTVKIRVFNHSTNAYAYGIRTRDSIFRNTNEVTFLYGTFNFLSKNGGNKQRIFQSVASTNSATSIIAKRWQDSNLHAFRQQFLHRSMTLLRHSFFLFFTLVFSIYFLFSSCKSIPKRS